MADTEVKIILDLAASGNLDKAAREAENLLITLDKIDKADKQRRSHLSQDQSAVTNSIKQTQDALSKLENTTKSLSTQQQKQVTDYKKQLQGLNGDLKILENAQGAVGRAQEESTKKQIENTRKLQNELKGLREQLDKANDPTQITKLEVAIADTQQRMREARNEAKLLAQQNKTLENSYDGIVLRNKELIAQIRRLPFNDASGDLDRLKREFNANTQALIRFDAELGRNFRQVGNYEEAIKNAAHSLSGLGGSLGGIFGSGGGSGGGGGILGIAGGALSGLGGISAVGGPALLAIGGLVAGMGSLFDATKEVNAELTKTASLTKLQGGALRTVTAELKATSNVFDQDYNETLRAANALVQQFGIDFSEAIDLINAGFVRGANINEDFLDILREYPTFFKEAGLEAENLVNISILGAKQGIFSDKAVDAVKESTLRLREMTTATAAALRGLDLVPADIEKGLRQGTLKIADVIEQVSIALGRLPADSKKVGTAIADIFGGPGEDAGLGFLLTLKDIRKQIDLSDESLNIYQKRLVESLRAEEDLAKAQTELSDSFGALGNQVSVLGTKTFTFIIQQLNKLLSLFISNSEEARIFAERIQGLNELESLKALEEAKNKLVELGEKLSILREESRVKVGGALTDGLLDNGRVKKEIEETAAAITKWSQNIADLEENIENIKNPIKELDENIKEQTDDVTEAEKAFRKFNLTLDEFLKKDAVVSVGFDLGGDFDKVLSDPKFLADFLRIFKKDLPDAILEVQQELRVFAAGLSKPASGLIDSLKEQVNFAKEQQDKIAEFNDKLKQAEQDGFLVTKNQLEKMREIRANLSDEEYEHFLRNEQKKQDAIEVTYAVAAELSSALFGIRINHLQGELDALTSIEEQKLAAVKDNEQATASIREEFDQRRKDIQRDQAKAERNSAIFSIILNTARAVVAALATVPPNVPLSIFVGSLGALQLATALSAPIPQFFKGVESSPEGPALVGEKGWELLERAGRFMFTNDGPQLMHLKAGTTVHTHEQSERLIRERPEIIRQALQIKDPPTGSQPSEKAIQDAINLQNKRDNQELIEGMKSAIKQMPMPGFSIDEDGLHKFITKAGSRVEIMNKRRKW